MDATVQLTLATMKRPMLSLAILLFSTSIYYSNAEGDFDVRKHLSTVSRYGVVKDIADNSFVPSDIPEGCVPIHLNLVARHGTRSPTKKRIRELDGLEAHLKLLISDAEKQNVLLDRIPSWLRGWESPWKGRLKGGELIIKGEEELYDLGIRTREKFPDLFDEDYHPDVYPIKATQVPRTSASAVAFGMGLFSGNGTLGLGNHRAFAVTSESRASDILLRFFDSCANYKNFRESQEPAVNKLKEPILDEITSALVGRYGLSFTRQDISSLWFLCKQEASLLDITNQACRLFSPFEITLLEWTDDLELYILKGYGKSLNYRMGMPLLEDVVESMDRAIQAKEEKRTPGSYEKARLRFAHAETVVPFSCLLGLFLEGSEFEQIQKEQPLQLPHKPPQKRKWRGSTVAPFAGNNMLILYSCSATDKSTSGYFVRVLHNEHPIPMPACHGSDFCPFEIFKEKVVTPHKKHAYDTICSGNVEHTGDEFSQMSLSQGKGDDTRKDEL
ncbi:multiple inositol polyphosphate phosphatase 1-like [Neltuma alba]|uniref:multiple inositol polyphosphate phosphatase 1-like n=1 Tax=Neltuma alba TaxID=207710 RepID=UPI0010A34EC0|nr:multiple inositol polyphosphate phosphatase 1-like [Prosopis alba]XP_028805212.1 multiple inositol polyphosphate phosphatase 1-like [Prosopis alba]